MDAKKTLHNLKQRYWWPNMRKDCKKYVRSCHKCQVVNRRTVNAYDDTPREDQLNLLILARAETANNAYEAHLENKHRFDLHRRSHSFKEGDFILCDWPKQGNHKLSPIIKRPFVIVRSVGVMCYEIKSRTLQNKFIKVVHVNIFAHQ
ncbi:down syndrome cell adhesion molecule-like protein Dscam2 [Trichonephila clavipes]|nr:down syndrome cell adhesion molecule-like protein Dscam2 [Trichonephila clavipes]